MYKIVGADNQEYGPVSQEEVLQWIAQGRANARTIARFEGGAWKPLATFDEFKAALNIPATAPTAPEFSSIPPAAPSVGKKTNVTSVVALIFGIPLCCCPWVGPILAIVLGLVGLQQIKGSPGVYSTDTSLPKIAITLGVIGLLLCLGLSIFSSVLQTLLQGLVEGLNKGR
jgi:hypothetical protein